MIYLSANCPLSNWYKEDFQVDGKEFSCMEQYLTYSKAALFHDNYARDEVMKETDQRIMKMIGTEIRDYNHADWLKEVETILYTGLRAKFLDGAAKKYLVETGTKIIGEASENRRWGTGVHLNDPNALDHSKWSGSNFMGQTLMVIREDICDGDIEGHSEKEKVNSDVDSENEKVNDMVKNGDNSEEKEKESQVSQIQVETQHDAKKPYAVLIGDANINLKLNVELPCEVKVIPIQDLRIGDIETRLEESGIDPDETAILILHAGSHEWSTSRTSDCITPGGTVFKHYREVIDNLGDKFTHTELILSGIPYRKPSTANGQRNQSINLEVKEANDQLDVHSQQQGFLTYVPHEEKLSPGGKIDSSLYVNSFELNKKGKSLILQNICERIPHALTRWGYSVKSDIFD